MWLCNISLSAGWRVHRRRRWRRSCSPRLILTFCGMSLRLLVRLDELAGLRLDFKGYFSRHSTPTSALETGFHAGVGQNADCNNLKKKHLWGDSIFEIFSDFCSHGRSRSSHLVSKKVCKKYQLLKTKTLDAKEVNLISKKKAKSEKINIFYNKNGHFASRQFFALSYDMILLLGLFRSGKI